MIARRLAVSGAALLQMGVVACTPAPAPTPLPTPKVTSAATPTPPAACADATRSYDPVPVAPLPPDSTMARLAARGRLIVGVTADAIPLAQRNTRNGDVEGFEIDLAHALAGALFGDESRIELRLIGNDRLQSSLNDGDVDLAIRQVGMTCEAWRTLRLSAPYAVLPVRLLLHGNPPPGRSVRPQDLTICANAGSHSSQLAAARGGRVVTEPTITACMVRFERGEVDAIAGTQPVLAGLARQDPYATVSSVDLGTTSLAVAVRADRADLAAWVNGVLAQRATGAWAASWNQWVRPYAGDATPPRPTYGRPR